MTYLAPSFTLRIQYEYTRLNVKRAPDMPYLFYLETLDSIPSLYLQKCCPWNLKCIPRIDPIYI